MIAQFWRDNPALEIGLALSFGVALALGHIWLLPAALVFRRLQSLLMMCVAFLWIHTSYTFPEAGTHTGQATLQIHQEKRVRSHFGKMWVVRATLLQLEGSSASNIPITIRYSEHGSRPDPAYVWRVAGTLTQSGDHWAHFKPDRNALWQPVARCPSWVEGRRQAKERVLFWIHRQIPNEKSADFLGGLLTGEFEDPLTRTALGRVGLHHIMAVSGMHFTLIAGFLTLLCRPLSSLRLTSLVMLALLTAYLWFVGPAPSVMRAWVMVALYWIGCLIGRESSALNSLGVALLVVILHDPLQVERIGFLFSFLICGVLILGVPVGTELMGRVWPRRSLVSLFSLSHPKQHLVILVGYFRSALTLTLVVHLAAIPLMIALFGQFPVAGLVFNLFFPPLISLSMLLLSLYWIPMVSEFNSAYTAFLLDLANRIPTSWNTVIYVNSPPPYVTGCYLVALFILLIKMKLYVNIKQNKQGDPQWPKRNHLHLKAAM